MGNAVTYPVNSPVMRLGEFSIYLINQRHDDAKGRNVRELVRVTDCNGDERRAQRRQPGFKRGDRRERLGHAAGLYRLPEFPRLSTTRVGLLHRRRQLRLDDLLTALRVKTLKEVTVNVVALTDDYPGKGIDHLPAAAAGRPRRRLRCPPGKFNYKTYHLPDPAAQLQHQDLGEQPWKKAACSYWPSSPP